MTGVKWLAAVGAVLLGIGLYAGLFVSHVNDGQVSVNCGSAWSPSRDAESKDTYMNGLTRALSNGGPQYKYTFTAQCEDALGSRGTWSAISAALGALTLLGCGFLVASRRRDAEPPSSVPSGEAA